MWLLPGVYSKDGVTSGCCIAWSCCNTVYPTLYFTLIQVCSDIVLISHIGRLASNSVIYS